MRQMIRDVHAELLREVMRVIESEMGPVTAEGVPPVVVTWASSEPWFSATFSGRRHVLDIDLNGASPAVITVRDAVIARMQDAELELRDHFVAGLAVRPLDVRREGARTICGLRLDALTIED